MKLTLKEATYILQKEILWCLDNPDKELTQDQQMGFMNGIRQAQILLERAERISCNLTPSYTDCTYCHCTTVVIRDGVCINCKKEYKTHIHFAAADE
jgi:hypothetical protein